MASIRESALEEIEARFAQETSEEKQEPLRALHALEAKLQQVRKEKPEAEALWTRIRKELGDTPPPYFQAIVMACCALFALTLDTLFLAPTMDILNIADPVLQFLAAAGIAALCTAYFELTGLLYIGAKNSWPKRLTAIAAGGIGVVSLTVWGLLARLSAQIRRRPRRESLGAVPRRAPRARVRLLHFHHARDADHRRDGAALWMAGSIAMPGPGGRVRERFETLRTAEIQLARDVQTEQEHLDQFDKRKQAQCLEWRAIFTQFYERGQRNGARQETRWSVLRKSLLGGVCATPLAFLLPLAWFPAHLIIPAIPGVGALHVFQPSPPPSEP